MAVSLLANLNQEATQSEMRDLIAAVQETNTRLAFLTAVRGVLADLRVTPTGTVTVSGTVTATGTLTGVTTVTTVTTLSTLTNQTNMGGYAANPQIPALMNSAAQANINNISIT